MARGYSRYEIEIYCSDKDLTNELRLYLEQCLNPEYSGDIQITILEHSGKCSYNRCGEKSND